MTPIRLVIAEVEGTLLTSSHALTPRTVDAVDRLREADIALALTGSRPPRTMRGLIEALRIVAPVAGFNGGMLVWPDLSVLEQHVLGEDVAAAVVRCMDRHALDVSLDRVDVDAVVTVVGLSDDPGALARCEADLLVYRADIAVARSGPSALVVTHPRANTGELVRTLSGCLGIPRHAMAAIGHAPHDILMFRECGLAIAMGHAGAAVQRAARFITRSNDDDGFAYAVETWIAAAAMT
jgi:hydroxymethylpyrimidine pyrophosphatase-like HAD family hydrolase